MTIDDERPLTEDMKRIVAEQKLAFVATVCPDGTANLSPKGTIAVWDDTHLVFVFVGMRALLMLTSIITLRGMCPLT